MEQKYKVGDRVRIKNFDWFRNEGANMVVVYMTKYYGEVVTIKSAHKGFYRIKEDGGQYCWIDEMFECKMEDECPQDFIETYCNSCGTQRCDRTKEYLNGCPYYNAYRCKKQNNAMEEETKPKYEDEVNGEYYSTPKYLVRPSGYQFVDENGNVINAQKIVLEKLVVPKFKKGDKIKDKNNRVWYVVEVGNRHFDISRIPNPKGEGTGYFVPMEDQDYYELVPDRELPKTFEECVSVLMLEGGNRMSLEQMNTFRKLIDARNAYWTIYGIENGLGKPWEPDWNDAKQDTYGLYNEVKYTIINPAIFVFPTEEMRDAFKENFNTDIEICKKLL